MNRYYSSPHTYEKMEIYIYPFNLVNPLIHNDNLYFYCIRSTIWSI